MTEVRPKILVPYDYTQRSDDAIKHAVLYAKTIGGDIVLLHVIDELSDEAADIQKLQEIADAIIAKYGVNITIKIRAGVISKVIKIVAETINAFVVIMKTQAPKGKERFLRSRSIRVMMGSSIPFIVVQEPPTRLAIRKVVFPIDFRKENKEKLIWISTLSRFYTHKVYFFKPKTKDYRIKANLDFSRRFLEGESIDYEIVTGKSTMSNPNEIIHYSKEIDAQLIIIMLSKRISWFSGLLRLSEQQYISNKYKIPIMCINPRIELHKYGGFY